MRGRRGARTTLAILAFAAAAACFAVGLAGESGSWLIAMIASLGFLTLGFFLASRPRLP